MDNIDGKRNVVRGKIGIFFGVLKGRNKRNILDTTLRLLKDFLQILFAIPSKSLKNSRFFLEIFFQKVFFLMIFLDFLKIFFLILISIKHLKDHIFSTLQTFEHFLRGNKSSGRFQHSQSITQSSKKTL